MTSKETKYFLQDRIGIITARKCPACGHHEIGYTSPDGVFHPLKPGTMVKLLEDDEIRDFTEIEGCDDLSNLNPVTREVLPWLPERIMGDRESRMIYGVFLERGKSTNKLTPEAYHEAYMEKLFRLIDREEHASVAILLDRFFATPHLASGNSREIADALWRDLDEVRRPVRLLAKWIQKEDEESLKELIHPRSLDKPLNFPVTVEEFREELERLTLEEFFELL